MGLPTFAIKRPVLIAMLFIGLLVLGLIALGRLPVELYQGQSSGIVSIIVRARGGLPPEEVEKLITKPVEESVATVSNLKNLFSHSREAESRVTLEFETGTDMDFAALEVREKFSKVRPLLPKEIEKPVIANYNDNDSAVLIFALTSQSMTPEDIRETVDSELKPILSRVSGVASVEVYGGRERKILVELDRDKMVAYNISTEKIMDVLGQANVNLLAGNVDRGTLEFAIRTMGAFMDVEEIGNLGVHATRHGTIIPLSEIATIKDSYMEPNDHARLNLEQNVTVYVKKTSLSNTIPVVKNAIKVVEQYEESTEGVLDIIIISDKAETIQKAINDVVGSLWVGMALAVLLIYVFLRNLVLAAIVLISIPASVIVTFIFMSSFGISINVMTLSGLALSIGILVDSSVVILENVCVKKQQGLSDMRAIREGSEEMWAPLLASLITTIVVFVPILFIDKKIQVTYAGLSFTVVASLIASFFVAQMLVPMQLVQWGRGRLAPKLKETSFTGRILKGMENGYARIMVKNLKFRYFVTALATAAFLFAGGKLADMDIDTPSTFEENEFALVIFPLAGARLDANDEGVLKIEELLNKIPDIEMFSSTVRKEDVKIFVRLKDKKKRQYSKDEIMQLLDEKGNEMIKEVHDDYSLIVDEGSSSSEGKKLVVNIFGHENDELQKIAQEYSNTLSKVDGLQNIVMTDLRKRPEYALVVDKGRAAYYGLSVKKIADSIHAQVRGMRPTKYREISKGEEIEVITRLQAIYRQKVEDLKYIYVQTKDGIMVPIGEFANFYPTTGPQTIDRKDKYRYVFVKGDAKKPLETLGEEVREVLNKIPLPDDYYWRFGGSYEELLQGKSELSYALLLTVFLVYMVMACMFQSYVQPLLIMVSVPMSSIGIWLGLKAGGHPLSNQVFIGMILLAGYVVNGAIIMIDHMNVLRKEHPDISREDVLIRSGFDRFRPILMTTLSTTFGFMPMALSVGQSSDLWAPLAVTVIGGLLSSTFLTLFILPNFIYISEELAEKAKSGRKALASLLGNLKKVSAGQEIQDVSS